MYNYVECILKKGIKCMDKGCFYQITCNIYEDHVDLVAGYRVKKDTRRLSNLHCHEHISIHCRILGHRTVQARNTDRSLIHC